jgi:hypothetical protein
VHGAAAGQPGSSLQPGNSSNPVNAFMRLQQPPTTVIMTGKPPLYFQHEGHSRTIVGIERSLLGQGPSSNVSSVGAVEYSLIVLDPGMPQGELLSSLRYGGDVICGCACSPSCCVTSRPDVQCTVARTASQPQFQASARSLECTRLVHAKHRCFSAVLAPKHTGTGTSGR